jgi:site-specific DNA-methyltransferase (cytosine-N4-specific)
LPHSQIIVADVLDGLAQIPSGSVQCVITSPPYYSPPSDNPPGARLLGKERTSREYLDNLVHILDSIYRVVRQEGTMFLILGNSYSRDVDCMPWRVVDGLQKAREWRPWHLRSDIIWHNDLQHEYAFLFSVDEEFYYDGKLRRQAVRPYVLTTPDAPQPFRFAYRAFPVELAKHFIEKASRPGDTILDPFSGSASTGVAALELGRKYIGIELDAETAEKSKSRLAAAHTLF